MTATLPAQIPDDLIELVEHRWDKKSRRMEGKMVAGRGDRSWAVRGLVEARKFE